MAAKASKRMRAFKEKFESGKHYSIVEAIDLLRDGATVKFDESLDVSIGLGVDPRKSDQVVRGAVVLPHGTGKTVRVAVFTQGEKAEKAKSAGADIVGFDDLAEQVKKGVMDFDVVIATPDAMPVVGKLGTILGPRGLMPNPKLGTVSADVETAVKNAKAGQARYRTDKGGIVHSQIGKISFTSDKLKENLETLVAALKKAKPTSAKGIYLKKISISTTMGPSVTIDISSIEV